MTDEATNALFCSFCGKSQHEVLCLIAGPTVFICDECSDVTQDIVEERRGKAATQGKYSASGQKAREVFERIHSEIEKECFPKSVGLFELGCACGKLTQLSGITPSQLLIALDKVEPFMFESARSFFLAASEQCRTEARMDLAAERIAAALHYVVSFLGYTSASLWWEGEFQRGLEYQYTREITVR